MWLQYLFRNCGELDCVWIDDLGIDTSQPNEEMYDICDYHNETFGRNKCYCSMAYTLEMKDLMNKKDRKIN